MRFTPIACLTLFLVVPLHVLPLHAQDSIVADRPGLADGPTTLGAGTAQLEIGLAYDQDANSLLTLPALLRYGITSDFELRAESAVLGFASGEHDWAPVGVGFKWRFREGDVPLSVLVSVLPPSGGGSLRADELGAVVRIVSDLDLGGGFSLTPNAGVALAEGGGAAALFAASVEREMGSVIPFIDFELSAGDGETSAIVDGGVAWIVNRNTQLDLSGGVRISGDYPDGFIAAGISRRF